VAAALLLAVGALMHAVLAGGVLLFLHGMVPEWLLLAAQPVAMAAGYGLLVAVEPRMRKRSPTA
jgi:hypothetical protein